MNFLFRLFLRSIGTIRTWSDFAKTATLNRYLQLVSAAAMAGRGRPAHGTGLDRTGQDGKDRVGQLCLARNRVYIGRLGRGCGGGSGVRPRTRWIVNNWLLLCRTMDPEVLATLLLYIYIQCHRVPRAGRPDTQCGNMCVVCPLLRGRYIATREEFNQLPRCRCGGMCEGSRVDLFMGRSTWVITTRRLSGARAL